MCFRFQTDSEGRRRPSALPRLAKSAGPWAVKFLFTVSFMLALPGALRADRLRLVDGTVMQVDEAWEDAQGVWYRLGSVTYLIERGRVRGIERDVEQKSSAEEASGRGAASKIHDGVSLKVVANDEIASTPNRPVVWIYLIGGARMEVDEASESDAGVWYKRGNLAIFIERARIERITREMPKSETPEVVAASSQTARRERFWTTGNRKIDALIRHNGAAHGVDPYLIFCVMEQESHFSSSALSPKGARGLMQLMPGTAARFGVRNAHDPAQNIRGGTRYLKELLKRFGGRVELVLASYNAGEGNVLKYGHRVPPFRETRNYVRRVSARYQRGV